MDVSLTQLLIDAQAGDRQARDCVFEQVYDELRRRARAELGRAARGTIDTTVLVHEVFLKLCDGPALGSRGRAHFLALSSRAMRQILVDHFRAKAAAKRGGPQRNVTLEEGLTAAPSRSDDVLAVDTALEKLEGLSPRLAKVVEYRFFGGLSQPQIAEILECSERTVRGDWLKAKAWLARELRRDASNG